MLRTYQPKKRQRSKEHGFRKRMRTANGRKVLARRRAKGRAKLSARQHCQRMSRNGANGTASQGGVIRPFGIFRTLGRL